MIPAHPLALTAARKLDERRQRALTRYYIDAGAGGIAVGVHTTQFAIHDRRIGLYHPVLQLAAETAAAWRPARRPLMVAGVVGRTGQALREAALARDLGYDAVLLGPSGNTRQGEDRLIEHARAVAEVMPLIGFYLQPGVGGRELPGTYWRRLLEIENLVAIKVAPFDRYRTQVVIDAVVESGRSGDLALYTGNDDHIILDLLTRYRAGRRSVRFAGGLLGHWAFWTRRAVEYHRRCRELAKSGQAVPSSLLTLAARVTEANSTIFDPLNMFRGCIPGIHEILRRQAVLAGRWCLNALEELSPGQMQAIDRVCRAYPELGDDEFVKEGLGRWLA